VPLQRVPLRFRVVELLVGLLREPHAFCNGFATLIDDPEDRLVEEIRERRKK